jgi:CysZ protein
MLAGLPALWPWALVPVLVFTAIAGGSLAFGIAVARPWLLQRLPEASSWYTHLGSEAASIVLVLLTAVLGWIIAALATPPLSAPALERIVAGVERELGLPERPALGFFRELACGFRATCGAALIGGALLFCLWLVELVFPPAVLVTVPTRLLVSSLLVAWSLFDYPLTLQGIGLRRRFAILRENFGCALGFGVAFSLLFWLPLCGVVLLPVGVAAATLIVSRLDVNARTA